MKYSGHRKLLCELSKLSKLNASIFVYKFRPEIIGFNMYAEYTQQQLIFLALLPCLGPFFVNPCVKELIFIINYI